jgi:5-methylcytosine-specific restriction endonuclease McrA
MAGTGERRSERLKAIFRSTSGRCHFCGDRLVLSRYATKQARRHLLRSKGWGWKAGYWEIDHVTQRHKGGLDATANYLPACIGCNRLRWHRKGKYTRESIFLGLIARHEIQRNSDVGKQIKRLMLERVKLNRQRRRRELVVK